MFIFHLRLGFIPYFSYSLSNIFDICELQLLNNNNKTFDIVRCIYKVLHRCHPRLRTRCPKNARMSAWRHPKGDTFGTVSAWRSTRHSPGGSGSSGHSRTCRRRSRRSSTSSCTSRSQL